VTSVDLLMEYYGIVQVIEALSLACRSLGCGDENVDCPRTSLGDLIPYKPLLQEELYILWHLVPITAQA